MSHMPSLLKGKSKIEQWDRSYSLRALGRMGRMGRMQDKRAAAEGDCSISATCRAVTLRGAARPEGRGCWGGDGMGLDGRYEGYDPKSEGELKTKIAKVLYNDMIKPDEGECLS